MNVEGYEQLAAVMQDAYDQAAKGKGAARHATGKPFHEQPMQDLIRLYGPGFALGQAGKNRSAWIATRPSGNCSGRSSTSPARSSLRVVG